jgi:5-methylthioribose kinase
MSRQEWMAAEADFPWLSDQNRRETEEFLRRKGWVLSNESVLDIRRAGEGNMNLTLQVVTSSRRFIVKQARPWVEKYDHIPAPWDRMQYECRFYERVSSISGVGDRMPRLMQKDLAAACIVLEDLSPARDMTAIYQGQKLSTTSLEQLAQYLATLHCQTRGTSLTEFANPSMRRLNHEHIFIVPISGWEGRDLDQFEPGLTAVSEALRRDSAALVSIVELGKLYLSNGPVLCHGDFYPGSWLQTEAGVRVIDAEFCHAGEPEHDLGVAVAHLALGAQPKESIVGLVESYRRAGGMIRDGLLAEFASIEVIRRLLGVAQLPIPVSSGFRAATLSRAVESLKSRSWEELG